MEVAQSDQDISGRKVTTGSSPAIRSSEAIVTGVLLVSGVLVVARALFGPFQFIVSVRNPVPAESWFGAAAVLLIALRATASRDRSGYAGPTDRLSSISAAAVLVIATAALWGWAAGFPFVADDYYHIKNGMQLPLLQIPGLFVAPAKDLFFRPLVLALYTLQAHAWGANRYLFHGASLALHCANGLLTFLLLSRYGAKRWAALAGALLFIAHGTRPEAVIWIGAQFDLWATLFFLSALLLFDSSVRESSPRRLAMSLGCLLCGLLSKESAYVATLVFLFAPALMGTPWQARVKRVIPVLLLTLACFAWRWGLLGGIGGYQTADKRPYIYQIGWRTLKAFTVRLAAILDFPLNWSTPLEWWLLMLLAAGIASLILLTRARAPRQTLLAGSAVLLSSVMPVHALLLIGSDLEKARVLYLPLIGFALIFTALVESTPLSLGAAAATGVLAFNAAAVEHNLKVWRHNGLLAEQTCAHVAAGLPARGALPVLSDVPNIIDGAYFLHTGLRGCVEWAAARSLPDLRIHAEPLAPPVTEPPDLVWSDDERGFVAAGDTHPGK